MIINKRYFITQEAKNELFLKELKIFEVGTPYWISIGIISDVIKSLSQEEFYKKKNIVFGRLGPEDLNEEFPNDEWKSKYFEFLKATDEIIEKHSLTHGEVSSILAELILSNTKYLIRLERHGDADKLGDEE